MLRFCSLSSGSSGSATLIKAADGVASRLTRLLVDCGMSARVIEQRLLQTGIEIAQLDAIFITHEHADHLGSALSLAARARLPVWASRSTWDVALAGVGSALA